MWLTKRGSLLAAFASVIYPAIYILLFSFILKRVQLFNTYATSAMCKAGIPVLDMYPLTAAWPKGTRDSIHYTDEPMEPAVSILQRYLVEKLLKTWRLETLL